MEGLQEADGLALRAVEGSLVPGLGSLFQHPQLAAQSLNGKHDQVQLSWCLC